MSQLQNCSVMCVCVGGGGGGYEWRSEAFVKIQKKKIFFLGGGWGSGQGGSGWGGSGWMGTEI